MSELKFRTSGKLMDGITHVCCPVCGHEYCSMVRVVVTQASKVAIVTRHETINRQHDDVHPRGGGRGSTVTICMQCENHHVFDVDFRFHKGMTEIVAVEGCHAEDFIESDNEQLWRD